MTKVTEIAKLALGKVYFQEFIHEKECFEYINNELFFSRKNNEILIEEKSPIIT